MGGGSRKRARDKKNAASESACKGRRIEGSELAINGAVEPDNESALAPNRDRVVWALNWQVDVGEADAIAGLSATMKASGYVVESMSPYPRLDCPGVLVRLATEAMASSLCSTDFLYQVHGSGWKSGAIWHTYKPSAKATELLRYFHL